MRSISASMANAALPACNVLNALSKLYAVQIEEISLVESDKISMSAMAARMPGLQLLKDTLSGDVGAK